MYEQGELEHLDIVLTEMCKRVNTEYDPTLFIKQDWFTQYSWTEEERGEFKEWLFAYMKLNKNARKELMQFPSVNSQYIEKFCNSFLFNYGWRLK